jgi:hypothetical protein
VTIGFKILATISIAVFVIMLITYFFVQGLQPSAG